MFFCEVRNNPASGRGRQNRLRSCHYKRTSALVLHREIVMGSTASAISSPTFNGSSTFSSSFQQVLTRAVQLASLPMQQMQNNVNDLTNQQNELTKLESTFVSLDTAVSAIDSAAAGTISTTVSDPTVVSATASSSALPGTYSILVNSLGSYTTTLSQAGSPVVADPTTQGISS